MTFSAASLAAAPQSRVIHEKNCKLCGFFRRCEPSLIGVASLVGPHVWRGIGQIDGSGELWTSYHTVSSRARPFFRRSEGSHSHPAWSVSQIAPLSDRLFSRLMIWRFASCFEGGFCSPPRAL